MIIPTKHQKLEENLISIGSRLLIEIKKNDIFIEDLFNYFKKEYEKVDLDNFFLCITFLWLIDSITITEDIIKIKK